MKVLILLYLLIAIILSAETSSPDTGKYEDIYLYYRYFQSFKVIFAQNFVFRRLLRGWFSER